MNNNNMSHTDNCIKRDHYSKELKNTNVELVTVTGWISSIRSHKNIRFVTIQDRFGEIQIVAKRGTCNNDIFDMIPKLKEHSSISVNGKLQSSEKSPNGVEIIPFQINIISKAEKISPFNNNAKTLESIDTRLDLRAIDLRRKSLRDLFLIRNEILKSIRKYFYQNYFVEVNTPKIISTSTEGGSSLFPVFYYNKEAFLAQSPQLYKEQLTMSFEKVFEISSIFRAEASRTNRHLSEAISIDFEEAFVNYFDIMVRLEHIIKTSLETLNRFIKCQNIVIDIPKTQDVIPKYTYDDLINEIQKTGYDVEWGDDISPKHLKKLGLNDFYFIIDWPNSTKPFYVKDKSKTISESFDLMYGDLEISSGSTRISNKIEIKNKMQNKSMHTNLFDYHLRVFDYGMPPHSGCGIGLERFLMVLTNTTNIRDVSFYPRDVDRLIP
ncbi:MAG: aspartate--tRNA(Asn) ligase [Thaumarchaeota archaeon]|nr:aspartate--tRNA(Asn) ligase [Nitrososphaerota archaeon]MCY3975601.1 aspartate--tRNA(Asn) ligase [Nitrososphaerota archaeon]